MKKPSLPKTAPPKLVKPLLRRPRIPSPPVPNPIAKVRQTGDPEKDRRKELEALKESFPPERQLDEKHARFAQATQSQMQRQLQALDNEYYFVVCFQTREQRDAFLRAKGWYDLLERFVYIDGNDLALNERIRLPHATQVHNAIQKPNKRLVDLA